MTEQNSIDETLQRTEKWRILKNIGAISIAYMFYYTAYSGAANLQSSINAEAGLGTASLAAVFGGGFISNIFLSSLVIKRFGTKRTICGCLIVYVPFITCQVYSKFYTLVPAALLLGLGAGPLWCALSTYLALAAQAHSAISKIPTKVLLQRFFGFFFMICQLGQIWGNLFSSLVLSIENKASLTVVNETMIPELCGANFLVDIATHEVLPTQPQEKINMITGVYIACMLVAICIVALGVDSMKRYESRHEISGKLSGLTLLAATMKQLATPDQLLFVAINIFIGLQQAFLIADFTASFVSCVIGTGSVGYVMMAYGVSDAVGCLLNSYVAKAFGRVPLFTSALLTHIGLLLTMLFWQPHSGDYYLLFLLALLWGLCDSVWVVQINAYYGVLFHGKEEAAFANFQLWGSVGYVIAFVLSSYVRTRYKIYLLLCVIVIGITGYFTLEYKHRKDKKVPKEFENSDNDCDQGSVLLNA